MMRSAERTPNQWHLHSPLLNKNICCCFMQGQRHIVFEFYQADRRAVLLLSIFSRPIVGPFCCFRVLIG